MTFSTIAFLPFLAGMVSAQTTPSQGSGLLVRSDAECRILVDGHAEGTVSPKATLQIALAPGEHRIEAVSSHGANKWQKTIELTTKQQELAISFNAGPGYWIDSDTKLMWTAVDNGSGLSWAQAIRHCQELDFAGYKDWTLPTIEDLQGIFKRAPSETGYQIKGPIQLTGWQWSATPGSQKGEGWAMDFGDGGRASVPAGDSGLNRALCVRHAKE